MTSSPQVAEHYGTESLLDRVSAALERAGLGEGPIAWSDLAGLDQFHVRGLAATQELAQALDVTPGARLLDIGSGLGGPARYLAATFGCKVTGVDLSQPFVEVASYLAARCGLQDRVEFRQADALDLPFEDGAFDLAWTQHVAMNIADRARLYGEIRRVLRPGGRLAIYDVLAGEGGPLIYPVPWARTAEISFLMTPEAMRQSLREAGFRELEWRDATEGAVAWLAERAAAPAPGAPGVGLPVVMGPDFPLLAASLARNLTEGRARLAQAVLEAVP
jgi:ubiquinone/menaquinone biosynthesis C-methylase UbiE